MLVKRYMVRWFRRKKKKDKPDESIEEQPSITDPTLKEKPVTKTPRSTVVTASSDDPLEAFVIHLESMITDPAMVEKTKALIRRNNSA